MLRVHHDPIAEVAAARIAKEVDKKPSQTTLARFFGGSAQSFDGAVARLDRRAAAKANAAGVEQAMTEHEQQQANAAAEQAAVIARELLTGHPAQLPLQ